MKMLSTERLATANIKNRAEASQLQTELVRLEKEKKDQLRMHNNEKQRFRARYSKTSLEPSVLEASDVKMYETHNPGFCYKRNGQQRLHQPPTVNPPVDFEHLHFLLFTDGEVDIEKVLCLHLLSAHETEHLAPPKRTRPISNLMKKESPLEQLIERSKEKQSALKRSMVLPTYVLDVKRDAGKSATVHDGRLACRLLVNEKILELILTVITTLEASNPEKVQHLMSIADDPSMLKRIFRKPHIQKFVITLKAHSLVSSCSSFLLTQPFKLEPTRLEIRTQTGALEELVRYIRANVLQFPKRQSLDMENEQVTVVTSMETKSSIITVKRSPEPRLARASELKVIKEPEEEDTRSGKFRRASVNFVAKNIAAVAGRKKSADGKKEKRRSESKRSLDSTKRTSSDLRRPSIAESSTSRKSQDSRDRKRRSSEMSESDFKYHLKQTTCPACMEKWRIPLPSPKVSKLHHKLDVANSQEDRQTSKFRLKTDSVQRIHNLIEREQYKLSSYDRRYSSGSTVSSLLIPAKKRDSIRSSSEDFVQLNVYDLEKIRQEIREKEAQKKLEKFLNEA